jgi:hypothetical protein
MPLDLKITISSILAAIGFYEKYQQNKKLEEQERILDYTPIKMYYFGQIGGNKPITGFVYITRLMKS